MATINGTGGNDTLNGTSSADVIYSKGGNDVVDGAGGNDEIGGGSGNDALDGGGGNDTIYGGGGADTVEGGAGNDLLFGGAGNDEFVGGSGDDTIIGGSGDDDLAGGSGADVFQFYNNHGGDSIQSYDLAEDTIELHGSISSFTISPGSLFPGPDGILGTADDQNTDFVIDTGQGTVTILTGLYDAGFFSSLANQVSNSIDII